MKQRSREHIAIIGGALSRGVNLFDTSAAYGKGATGGCR
jgi:aryl-alcohol dehydrogenase-like predicted oxidoreductase